MRRDLIICLGLAATTLALFWPLGGHDFINFDDPDYVTQNPVVQAGLTWHGIQWAFGASHANNWHPLTWLSHMLDCQLFGLKPGPHHLSSLALHIFSTLLLFLALCRMTGAAWCSAFVAALFAWHPLHVESIAWVAERKDVLSGLFFMLTLWAYVRYAEARIPKPTHQAPRSTLHALTFYGLALTFLALGLMSKPMVVTLPFVLLLLDYWPLQRIATNGVGSDQPASRPTFRISRAPLVALLMEKVPFLALALTAGLLTLRAQHLGGAVTSLEQLPFGTRLANAIAACATYLGKAFWPTHLSVFYPHSPVPGWKVALSALLLLCATLLCLRCWRSRPYLPVGWFWFVGMLLPVIGLVQVGWQALADRYTYLPLIGVCIMLTWGVAELRPHLAGWKVGLGVAAILTLAACAIATRCQLMHWRDSLSLFQHALAVNQNNWLAHNNLGTALAEQGKLDEAGAHFHTAVKLNPAYDDALNNFGRYLAEREDWVAAQSRLETLVRRNPSHARAHRNLGYVLLAQGRVAEGVAQYALAQRLRPDDAATPADLAAALARQAQSAAALPSVREALGLLPTAEMRAQLAGTWAGQGKFQFALEGYRSALALQPHSPELLNNLAWFLATCPDAAIRDGAEAVRLAEQSCALTQSRRAVMVGTLAAAYAEAGRFAEAVATARKAVALASEAGDEALALKNRELLEHYEAGRAYREPARPD